jgi:hypothetical protein
LVNHVAEDHIVVQSIAIKGSVLVLNPDGTVISSVNSEGSQGNSDISSGAVGSKSEREVGKQVIDVGCTRVWQRALSLFELVAVDSAVGSNVQSFNEVDVQIMRQDNS